MVNKKGKRLLSILVLTFMLFVDLSPIGTALANELVEDTADTSQTDKQAATELESIDKVESSIDSNELKEPIEVAEVSEEAQVVQEDSNEPNVETDSQNEDKETTSSETNKDPAPTTEQQVTEDSSSQGNEDSDELTEMPATELEESEEVASTDEQKESADANTNPVNELANDDQEQSSVESTDSSTEEVEKSDNELPSEDNTNSSEDAIEKVEDERIPEETIEPQDSSTDKTAVTVKEDKETSSIVEKVEEPKNIDGEPERKGTTKQNNQSISPFSMMSMADAPQSPWTISDLSGLPNEKSKAHHLAESLVGSGIVIADAKFTGVDTSAGSFETTEDIIGFNQGIILSSGNVHYVKGPNEEDSISEANDLPGDSSLNSLLGETESTGDATVLEFQFIPTSNELYFEYVFSSDEYNEYVNSRYNDVFGFFVNGVNVATLPGTDIPVSINNVNAGNPVGNNASNSAFYINNDRSDSAAFINTEMDGLTVVLPIKAKVKPNEFNTIKLAIADVGDRVYDSNVFIRTASFVGQADTISGLGSTDNIKNKEVDESNGTIGVPVIDPVDSATGAQVMNQTLLEVNGAFPLTFDVIYNSLLLDEGMMGAGWTNNYEISLQEHEDGRVSIYWDSNRVNTFAFVEQSYVSADAAMKNFVLSKNEDESFTLTKNNGERYEFNVEGQLVEQYNANQQVIEFSYNDSGQLTYVTEPISGQTLTLAYNESGLLTTVTDLLGRDVQFIYDDEKSILVKVVDAAGTSTTYTYNETNQIEKATDHAGHQIFVNTFDEEGRVIEQQDAKGQKGTFVYNEIDDENLLITTYTNRAGDSQVFTYNNLYQLVRHTDEVGNTRELHYDEEGNLIKEIDEEGNATTYTYDENGNMLTMTDALGRTTEMTYDDKGNLKSIENPKGDATSFTYNERNQIVKVVDPMGQAIRLSYDDQGLLLSQQERNEGVTQFAYTQGLVSAVTNPKGGVIQFEYDAIGRLTTVTDEAGFKTHMEYDSNDNLTKLTDELGQSTLYSYDDFNNLIQEKNPKGSITKYSYDKNNNLIGVTDARNHTVTYGYDNEDRVQTITDAKGNTTTLTYDDKGRNTAVTNPLGNTMTIEYDKVGNIIKQKDALGETVASMSYDAVGNLTQIKNALGHIETFKYDSVNNLIESINPNQSETMYEYDALGRVVGTTNAMGATSQLGYDENGNRTSIVDNNGNELRFQFNKNGELTTIQSASGQHISYEYDARGLVTKMTNGRGQVTSYQYDGAGRVVKVVEPTNTTDYTYDENGNILTITDQLGTIRYAYNALDQLVKYTDVYGNTIKYEYDSNGNLTKLTYPDGKEVEYAYDRANQLTQVKDWAGRITKYTYDENSRLIETIRPNGTLEKRTYNSLGQITKVEDVTSKGEILNAYSLSYDNAGNVISESTSDSYIPAGVTNTQEMTYSAENRLETYNSIPIEYDMDGNMLNTPINGDMLSLHYDNRNRLVQAGETSYSYDANNERVAVTANGITTRYVINPNAALSQLLMETDEEGTPLAYYVYGLGLIGFEQQDNYYHYHYDYRGSVIAITDMNEEVQASYGYDPYGQVVHAEGEIDQPFLYTGRFGIMTDKNGLNFMRERYYNPSIGRFISKDNFLGTIARPLSFNRYIYTPNNPISYIDPLGRDWITIGLGVIGTVAGVVGLVASAPAVVTAAAVVGTVAAVGTIGYSAYLYGTNQITGKEALFNTVTSLPGLSGIKGIKTGVTAMKSGTKTLNPTATVWDGAVLQKDKAVIGYDLYSTLSGTSIFGTPSQKDKTSQHLPTKQSELSPKPNFNKNSGQSKKNK